jgi:uncharacterized RDD family membrane protein YckC
VEFEDRLVIATPEGVDLDLRLAGLGSRLIAALIDLAIRVALFLAVTLLVLSGDAEAGDATGALGAAVLALLLFLLLFGYDVLFETRASGRTPGKRRAGLRVVLADGRPVTFTASALRTVVRLVDFLPGAYLAGSVTILLTRRNQRLGDLAAGTLVVRESVRRGAPAPAAAPGSGVVEVEGWDAGGVTAEDIATVRQFLARRPELTPAARSRLARTLADAIRPRVHAPDAAGDDERFLEQVAAAKAPRG